MIEINATLASAGNVTPGDAPGFPIDINQAGSYRLTSNLVVPPGVSGIVISASGTQLDLNGFTISSTTTCSGDPLNCTPAAGGIGIEVPIASSVAGRDVGREQHATVREPVEAVEPDAARQGEDGSRRTERSRGHGVGVVHDRLARRERSPA
ncbi:MAG TPA: hypothetical protein VLV15_16760, partial [Dongiaceae bacterium]|nr:hypothetical protein [Dongiaceae bacterium]